MKKTFIYSAVWVALFFSTYAALEASGIAPAIVPASVPAANKQGNSNVFMLAGTVGGSLLGCTDGSGNFTTSGCSAFAAPAPQFVQVTPVAVTGTTQQTLVSTTNAVGTNTLPANFFSAVGSFLRMDYQGTWNQGGSGTNSDQYLITLGGTTVSIGGLNAVPAATASVNHCGLHLIFTATAVGASGVLASNGLMLCDTPGGASLNPYSFEFVGQSNTINTTGTLVFDFRVTPNAGVANAHTITSTNLVLAKY